MCLFKNFNIATDNLVAQVCLDPSSTKLKDIKEALLFPALCARRMATIQCGVPAPCSGASGGVQPLETPADQRVGGRGQSVYSPSCLHTRWWFPQ